MNIIRKLKAAHKVEANDLVKIIPNGRVFPVNRRKQTLAQASFYQKGSRKRVTGKRGFRPDLGHSVRSELEAQFARWLNMQAIFYDYEVPIKLEITWPIDFRYYDENRLFYAEVKGHLDQASMTRLRLLKEQKPMIFDNLLLVTTSKGHGRNWEKVKNRLKRLGLRDDQIMDLG